MTLIMNMSTSLALLYNAILAAVSIFALKFGSGPERIGAIANLAGSVVTGAVIYSGLEGWGARHLSTWIVDLSVTGCFFWLAIASLRFWPIWCFGFALSDVILHVTSLVLPSGIAPFYQSEQVIWAYTSLGALALATARLSPMDRGCSACGWRREGSRTPGDSRKQGPGEHPHPGQ